VNDLCCDQRFNFVSNVTIIAKGKEREDTSKNYRSEPFDLLCGSSRLNLCHLSRASTNIGSNT
jgi:hypothetical protein